MVSDAQKSSVRRWGLLAIAAFLLHPMSAMGLVYPDTDFLLFPLLGHRSLLTHSILLPLLTLWLMPTLRRLRARFRAVPAGVADRAFKWGMGWFLLGLAIHLLADTFPNGCTGFALAKVPRFPFGLGTFAVSCPLSLLWFGGNAVAAVCLAEWLLRSEGAPITLARYVASGAVLTVYVLVTERKPGLLLVVAGAWLAVALLARHVAKSQSEPGSEKLGVG